MSPLVDRARRDAHDVGHGVARSTPDSLVCRGAAERAVKLDPANISIVPGTESTLRHHHEIETPTNWMPELCGQFSTELRLRIVLENNMYIPHYESAMLEGGSLRRPNAKSFFAKYPRRWRSVSPRPTRARAIRSPKSGPRAQEELYYRLSP